MQATTTRRCTAQGTEAAAAMLLLVAMGVMVAVAMVTMPMEEVATVVTTVATGASPQATTVMVGTEAMLLVVSVFTIMTSSESSIRAIQQQC